ncbi:hypothetical protein B0H19DRAFT_1187961 [Mycena capillaripes]|nr:hypothetical protein B0H19DRAFT_1187961 [Mycena capillaripes]
MQGRRILMQRFEVQPWGATKESCSDPFHRRVNRHAHETAQSRRGTEEAVRAVRHRSATYSTGKRASRHGSSAEGRARRMHQPCAFGYAKPSGRLDFRYGRV